MMAMVLKLLVRSEMKMHGQYGEEYFLLHVNNFIKRYIP